MAACFGVNLKTCKVSFICKVGHIEHTSKTCKHSSTDNRR